MGRKYKEWGHTFLSEPHKKAFHQLVNGWYTLSQYILKYRPADAKDFVVKVLQGTFVVSPFWIQPFSNTFSHHTQGADPKACIGNVCNIEEQKFSSLVGHEDATAYLFAQGLDKLIESGKTKNEYLLR